MLSSFKGAQQAKILWLVLYAMYNAESRFVRESRANF